MNAEEANEPAPKPALTRQVHLHTLAQFMATLADAIKRSGTSLDKLREAVRTSMAGECAQCHIRVSGDELLALPMLDPADVPKDRTARLRQGYCVRNGCDSRYFSLTFAPHLDVDWSKLLSQTEPAASEEIVPPSGGLASREIDRIVRRRRLAIRLCVAFGVLAVILLLRQWYFGGRIPWIREPENFQVDRLPAGRQMPR